jgi:hypothetical protein
MIKQFIVAVGHNVSQESANMVVPIFAGFVFGPIAFLPWLPVWNNLSFTFQLVTFFTLTAMYYLPLYIVSHVSFETSNILPQNTKIAKVTRKAYLIINACCGVVYLAISYFKIFCI